MSHFCMLRHEAPADTFRRVAAEQVQLAISLARSSATDPDNSTHEIRKCTKRVRSLLRLFREGLEETTYRSEMRRFRDISAALATHRLNRVNLDVVDTVAMEKRHGIDPDALARFKEALQAEHQRYTAELAERGVFEDTGIHLETSLLREIPADLKVDFSQVSDQIASSQKAFRRNLNLLEQQDSAEAMHELRKNVKTLWYQLTLLRTLWQPVLGSTIHQLDMLAEKLGRDHDLHEMIVFLQNRAATDPGSVPAGMADYLEKKRRARKKAIISLAGKLGAEKPSALGERLEGYFRNL